MLRAVTAVPVGRFARVTLLSLPLVYVLFDLLENSIVLVPLSGYPDRLDTLAMNLPYATTIKRIASLLAIGVPLIVLGLGSFTQIPETEHPPHWESGLTSGCTRRACHQVQPLRSGRAAAEARRLGGQDARDSRREDGISRFGR